MQSLASPFPIFTDIEGNPLESGYLYVGTAGLNAETNPISAFWDADLTIPAAQPIRTLNGYPSRNGAPAVIYIEESDASLIVKNKNGSLVFSTLNITVRVDSGFVEFIQSGTGAVLRTMLDKERERFTFDDFIPVGTVTASVDCSGWIQKAIEEAFAAGKLIEGVPGRVYGMSNTLLIPQVSPAPTFAASRRAEIDGKGCVFMMLADVTLFESAYYSAGSLVSNFGTPYDSHYSINTSLHNFTVQSNVGNLNAATLRIQDWHQGCEVKDIASSVSKFMFHYNNSYYLTIDNVNSTLVGAKAGDRFVFGGSVNLNKFSRLVAGTANTGYRFDSGVTATQLTNLSLEGQTIGISFNGAVYDVAIENCYMEGFSDIAVYFGSYVEGARLSNNYVNFLNSATSYFLGYNPLPGINIEVTQDNFFEAMPSDANLIKVREDVYGDGIVIHRTTKTITNVSELLVDNLKLGARIDWRQKGRRSNFIGNVNNVFAVGNYSGKFTDGWSNSNGFEWLDTGTNTLSLRTAIAQNFVQLVYVNIEVAHSAGPTKIAGVFVGNQFYEFVAATGLVTSTKLTGATDVNGFFRIDGGIFFNLTVTGCNGEVRMI